MMAGNAVQATAEVAKVSASPNYQNGQDRVTVKLPIYVAIVRASPYFASDVGVDRSGNIIVL